MIRGGKGPTRPSPYGQPAGADYAEAEPEVSEAELLELERQLMGDGATVGSGAGPDERKPAEDPDEFACYVGGLNKQTTREEMTAHFAQAGEIFSISFAGEKQGQTLGAIKGIGFVKFTSEEAAAQAVLMLNASELNGATIKVDRWKGSKPKDKGKGKGKDGGKGWEGALGGGWGMGGWGGAWGG
eukprot:CAMPEP_0203961134 /NCGR_PEP_ID=MMETSP0359-20131031/91648_1 /ASSEMBLY_ACC=CAM_ASM_000338 /TAXON_ID=268821 /ORGANISM="Scrippsiella Hangoei, Strain SHTV-5" /LENGTH=184 /DNA_ID=CAMNT_0050895803 /DNA_START=50 /DNA_END=600 /DNA_ORIENTATION=+